MSPFPWADVSNPFYYYNYHAFLFLKQSSALCAQGQPESTVHDIENMVHSYIENVMENNLWC